MGQKKVCFNRRENETGEKGARGTREYIDTAEMSLLGPIYLGPLPLMPRDQATREWRCLISFGNFSVCTTCHLEVDNKHKPRM